MAGNPNIRYSQEMADKICEQLADGVTLREICRQPGMPKWRTVYDWKRDHPEFSKQFEEARDVGFDAIAEDTIRMIDEKPERTPTERGDKVDAGHVAWQKNRVEQRLKLLAKWSPKRYGDKLALGGADDLPPIKTMPDEALSARIAALQAKINGRNKG